MPDSPLTSPNPLQSLTTSCDETSINIFRNHTENENKKEDALAADGDEQSTENLFILLIEESGMKKENTVSNEDKINKVSSAEEEGGEKVFMNEKAKESYLRYKTLRPDISDGLAKSKYDTVISMDECVSNEVEVNPPSELQRARLPTIQSNDALVNPVNYKTYTNKSNDNSSIMNIQTNPVFGLQDSNSPETHNSLFKNPNVESCTKITANLLMGECSSKDSEIPPSASPPSAPPPSAPLSVRRLSSTLNICTDSLFKDLNLENYTNITNTDRFIVDSNVLFSLFQKCRTPGCGASAIIVKKKTRGAVLCVNVKCSSGHFFEWSSSGESRGLYSTNLLLSAATVLSGNWHQKLEQFLKYMKVKYVTARYTQLIERRYLTPSIDDFYNRIKSDVLINPEKSMFKFSSNVTCGNRDKVAEIDRYFQFDPKSLTRAKRAPRNSLKGKKKKKKAKKKKDYWYIPYFLARILYQREMDTSRLASKERPTFVEDMR
ncbi:uncharacterized protein LOC130642012 isoform X2 [Hydractinia symbiolongicarpus]|nr:uncharacterized protein LOC130642012 isoform X2 [Hydractinia symbiolongicarpus]